MIYKGDLVIVHSGADGSYIASVDQYFPVQKECRVKRHCDHKYMLKCLLAKGYPEFPSFPNGTEDSSWKCWVGRTNSSSSRRSRASSKGGWWCVQYTTLRRLLQIQAIARVEHELQSFYSYLHTVTDEKDSSAIEVGVAIVFVYADNTGSFLTEMFCMHWQRQM